MTPFLVLLAAALGAGLLWASWTRRWLTASGSVSAAVIGLALWVGLGWRGVLVLVFFFVSSSILTRWRVRTRGPADTSVQTGRTAGQVLANGGVATLAALIAAIDGRALEAAMVAASGSLATAAADTWASEIGEWARRDTRLLTTWRPVPPGTDGAVSWPGSVAGAIGGLAVAAVSASACARPDWLLPVALAAVGGMGLDSVLGATVEGRYGWLGNDAVNWAGTCTGALLALMLASRLT